MTKFFYFYFYFQTFKNPDKYLKNDQFFYYSKGKSYPPTNKITTSKFNLQHIHDFCKKTNKRIEEEECERVQMYSENPTKSMSWGCQKKFFMPLWCHCYERGTRRWTWRIRSCSELERLLAS